MARVPFTPCQTPPSSPVAEDRTSPRASAPCRSPQDDGANMNVVGSQPALSPDASWVLVMLFSDEPVTSDDVHRWLRSMDISTDQSPFIEGHECPHVWDIVLDRTVAERLPLESMGFTTCHGSDRSLANRWEPQRQAEMAFIRIASKAIRQMADTGYSSAFRAAAGLDFLRRSVEREILLGDLRESRPEVQGRFLLGVLAICLNLVAMDGDTPIDSLLGRAFESWYDTMMTAAIGDFWQTLSLLRQVLEHSDGPTMPRQRNPPLSPIEYRPIDNMELLGAAFGVKSSNPSLYGTIHPDILDHLLSSSCLMDNWRLASMDPGSTRRFIAGLGSKLPIVPFGHIPGIPPSIMASWSRKEMFYIEMLLDEAHSTAQISRSGDNSMLLLLVLHSQLPDDTVEKLTRWSRSGDSCALLSRTLACWVPEMRLEYVVLAVAACSAVQHLGGLDARGSPHWPKQSARDVLDTLSLSIMGELSYLSVDWTRLRASLARVATRHGRWCVTWLLARDGKEVTSLDASDSLLDDYFGAISKGHWTSVLHAFRSHAIRPDVSVQRQLPREAWTSPSNEDENSTLLLEETLAAISM